MPMVDLLVYIILVYGIVWVSNLSGNQMLVGISHGSPLIAVILLFIFFPKRRERFRKLGVNTIGGIRWYMLALLAGIPVIISFLFAWLIGMVQLPSTATFPHGMDQMGRFFY